ncbi:EF-hand domain-containing protein [Amphiplicatus metriothermophilus]|uniref:Ca2+-binding protein, EF-hand superfamily n=1 Tax=Amphiplicatus metriothermophilus TaxID=1519374 RepID=A0A239PTW0_9PROT|nr:EF-hand domain-containing protein [Amphiplicatus metriothermophilus]MBB5519361.1 Ca2+-binding EF-hand superfamily protein [Amphiplicatus metriothermophilus]SNT73473.1 Ca2+-binding protein, EF-hand superfamily [Amphiplicatus metriothermophilus]
MKRMTALLLFTGLSVAAGVAAAASAGPDGRWEKLDRDGDGAVSFSEMMERHRAMFEAADANGDGAVSREEMKAFHEKKRAEMKARRFPDRDGDGVVSKAEFRASADERFDRLDADGDGVLTEEEMKAGRHGWKRRHH